jgi:hypothetical protein
MSKQMDFEELKNIKKIKYTCSKHGTLYKPEVNTFFMIKDEKITPFLDVWCPACISEFYGRLTEDGVFGEVTYEAEYEEGYEPKIKERKTGEIKD